MNLTKLKLRRKYFKYSTSRTSIMATKKKLYPDNKARRNDIVEGKYQRGGGRSTQCHGHNAKQHDIVIFFDARLTRKLIMKYR